MDKEPDKGKMECEIDIWYSRENGAIRDLTVSSKSAKETTVFSTRKWQLEGYLFRLYANHTKIIAGGDSDYIDTYVPGEYDD
jgi:hypothetical protein